MSALQVTYDGRNYTFAPGAIVRIGRSSENDIVVNDPTVSRRHAQLSWEAAGWVWQNAGQAPTFLAGQPVAQFAVGQQVDVCLAAPQGPALRLESAPAQGPGPMKTELAAGAGQTNVAGQSPGYGGPGRPGQAAGFAAAGAAAGLRPGRPAECSSRTTREPCRRRAIPARATRSRVTRSRATAARGSRPRGTAARATRARAMAARVTAARAYAGQGYAGQVGATPPGMPGYPGRRRPPGRPGDARAGRHPAVAARHGLVLRDPDPDQELAARSRLAAGNPAADHPVRAAAADLPRAVLHLRQPDHARLGIQPVHRAALAADLLVPDPPASGREGSKP